LLNVPLLVLKVGFFCIFELKYKTYEKGYTKNSEIYRKLYRDMGYSLSGYWEVFYWDVNNEKVDEYNPIKQNDKQL
jgi:hypothetical protein